MRTMGRELGARWVRSKTHARPSATGRPRAARARRRESARSGTWSIGRRGGTRSGGAPPEAGTSSGATCYLNRDGRIRTGDPLNPMDPTAEARVSNLVQNRGSSGIRMLNLVSPFAWFHTVCILPVHTPVNVFRAPMRRSGSPRLRPPARSRNRFPRLPRGRSAHRTSWCPRGWRTSIGS